MISGRAALALFVILAAAPVARSADVPGIDTSPAAMRARLAGLLHRLVEDGKHYGPGVLWVEDHKKVSWFQGQAIAMMAAAYPYAAPADQPALRDYLRKEITDYLFDAKYIHWETLGTLTRPGNETLKWTENHAPGWLAVYGLAAYARATGDWALLKDNQAYIVGLCRTLRTPPNQIVASRNVVPLHNAHYAGAWAMADIGKQLDDAGLTERGQTAMSEARKNMLANIDEGLRLSAGGDGRIRFVPCLEALTPEAAAVYAGEPVAKDAVAKLIAQADGDPFWPLSGLDLGGAGGEGSFQPPQFAAQIFLAKRWILGEPYDKLARQLPWPNVYAAQPGYRDLHYLYNLAALLAAAPVEAVGERVAYPQRVAYDPTIASAEPLQASPGQWTQFLGSPARMGQGPASFPALKDPPIRWKTQLGERPMLLAHPLVIGNAVILTNMDGKVTALNAATGTPLWEFQADGPVGVCPAFEAGRLHFGDFAGFQYCLDAGSGKLIWKLATGAPIWSAPCEAAGKVFFGNNDGLFLAVAPATGEVLWKARLPERILSNPAFFDGRVYVAAADMTARAFAAADGAPAWTVRMTGESNRFDCPTVVPAAKAVLFTSVPHQPMGGMGMKDLYSRYYLGHVAFRDGKWSKHPFTLVEALTNYRDSIRRVPDQESVLLLDAATGAKRTDFWLADDKTGKRIALGMLPMNLWYHNANNRPLVVDERHILIQCFGNMLKIDAVEGGITELYPDGIARGDEYTPVTVWDNVVYAAIAGNMATLNRANNKRRQLRGVYGQERADFTPIDSRIGRWRGGTGDGGYQGSGHIIIDSGRLYYSSYGWIYCFASP